MDPSFPEMLEWGWHPWPDSEEYSYFFVRVLASAQGGAATISECISASKNIVPGDGESWFRARKQLAETNRARADRAFERSSLQAATSHWLKASNYYRTSELFLAAEDERRRAAILDMRKCAQSYLENSVPKGDIVQIPIGKSTMEAYYLRANGNARQPVVVCVGSTDDFKEDLLCSIPRIASESGYSVLLVDVIGSGTGIRDGNAIKPVVQVEDVISHWIDHLFDWLRWRCGRQGFETSGSMVSPMRLVRKRQAFLARFFLLLLLSGCGAADQAAEQECRSPDARSLVLKVFSGDEDNALVSFALKNSSSLDTMMNAAKSDTEKLAILDGAKKDAVYGLDGAILMKSKNKATQEVTCLGVLSVAVLDVRAEKQIEFKVTQVTDRTPLVSVSPFLFK